MCSSDLWSLAVPNDYRVLGQRYAEGGGALGINFEIARFNACCATRFYTDVAMDGSGNFVAAWDGGVEGVVARLYDGP